uniref:3-dehydroquinate synthase n=3 Tax=Anthurium amnicola TaxID=1678845 RepID=A0A1D1YZ45_9ARAE
MALLFSPSPAASPSRSSASLLGRGGCCRRTFSAANCTLRRVGCHMGRCSAMASRRPKLVWVWTESQQVLTAAVESGWSTFVFPGDSRELANEWSSIALIHALIIEGSNLFDGENKRTASFYEISSPQQLQQLQPDERQAENVVISLQGGWQVIPAENIVAAFQGCQKTVLAIATSSDEAQVFLEALEQGLGGVVLKVDSVEHILKLKDYFDRINDVTCLLTLISVTVTRVQVVGMGDRVCVDLCSIMQPGEGLLVGSFARGLFLVHSECLESSYIASRPFRVNAGPVHAYVAVPGGKTCYLSELHAGKEVIVVDQKGHQRTAIVGRVKVESRPLILVEAKEDLESDTSYSIFLQNAETVSFISSNEAENHRAIPVTTLKAGDKVLLRAQGAARHTGIEIQEFVLEK